MRARSQTVRQPDGGVIRRTREIPRLRATRRSTPMVITQPVLTIALDYPSAPSDVANKAKAAAVAAILMRPCFSALNCLTARKADGDGPRAAPTVVRLAEYILDGSNDTISLESCGGTLTASAEIQRFAGATGAPEMPRPSSAYFVVPYAAKYLKSLVSSACDLAAALGAVAGYIALEPRYAIAYALASGRGGSLRRSGVSRQRNRERRGRVRHPERKTTELAGVEWGTFLGPGHLRRVDLTALQASGAFARITRLTPALAYLQVTATPGDDLSERFEDHLGPARRALGTLLMDLSPVGED